MKDRGSGKKAEEKERRTAFRSRFPFQYAQMGVLWNRKNLENMAYNMPVTPCFTPETDPEALIRAVRSVGGAPPAHVHFRCLRDRSKVRWQRHNETDDVARFLSMRDRGRGYRKFHEFIHAFHSNRGPLFFLCCHADEEAVCPPRTFHHLIFGRIHDGPSPEATIPTLRVAIQEETADYADSTGSAGDARAEIRQRDTTPILLRL